MQHGRSMEQIKLALETVVHTDYFQDLLFQLHTCQEDVCTPDCIKKKSALGITAVVLDSVDASVDKLRTPHGLFESQIIKYVHIITPQIWDFYKLGERPFDTTGYTMRNQTIHLAIYVKCKHVMQAEPNFRGWKS